MTKRLATFYDDIAQKRFDLGSLTKIIFESKIFIGRAKTSHIQIGEDSNSEKIKTVSRTHAVIAYDPLTDTFSYKDNSSNGSFIKRDGKKSVHLTRESPPENLETGDQIYFSREVNKGYGPVIFRQTEVEIDEEEKTQKID